MIDYQMYSECSVLINDMNLQQVATDPSVIREHKGLER